MIAVVIDTLIICTSTAFIILLSGTASSGKTGIELSQLAMTHELGGIGKWVIFISILFFAFTTLLADIYYGEVNLQCLFKDNKVILNIYKVIALLLVVLGSVIEPSVIWELADFFNALMIFLNVIALFILSKYVKNVLND
jgi:AGCS family alanine or glycine:cation symporter